MNLLDAYVTERVGDPYQLDTNTWFQKVKYDCYGRISESVLYFDTKEEAEQVQKGYHFLT